MFGFAFVMRLDQSSQVLVSIIYELLGMRQSPPGHAVSGGLPNGVGAAQQPLSGKLLYGRIRPT